jgi:hypothetical protein
MALDDSISGSDTTILDVIARSAVAIDAPPKLVAPGPSLHRSPANFAMPDVAYA